MRSPSNRNIAERFGETKQTGRLERYDVGNRRAAEIITAEPGKYGGEQSAIVRWARAVIQRQEAGIEPVSKQAERYEMQNFGKREDL